MLICAAGDIHGALDRFYANVIAFESTLGIRFEYVLHVGDFGIWPDPDRIDKATRKHEGVGDFPEWNAAKREVPRKTVFIKGNHDDFPWLDALSGDEVVPGLVYLRSGCVMDLGDGRESLRVGGVGGCFGPSDYERPSKQLQGYAKRHYTRDEIDTLARHADIDVLLVHDAPAGVRFEGHRGRASYVSEAAGLAELVGRVRPRVCFFGHHHAASRRRDRRCALRRAEPGRQTRQPRRHGFRDGWAGLVDSRGVAVAPPENGRGSPPLTA